MTYNDKDPQANDNRDADLTIGERIQKKRKELELSVEDLAALTAAFDYQSNNDNQKGLSSQTLYRYEKNEREPASREIKLLCGSLNVSADWLLFGELWNSEYEEDSKLAQKFRDLVSDAVNPNIMQALKNKSKSRDQMHSLKLSDIKTRKK